MAGSGRGARAADLALVVVPRPATTAAQGLVGVSIGALLAATTGASALDAFLATTPGGLYAVLATARDGGADPTFVLAVRVLRRFAVLLAAPLLARWLRHTGE